MSFANEKAGHLGVGGAAQFADHNAEANTSSYDRVKALGKQLKRPALTLIALAPANDPYYANTPGRREGAEWFAELWRRLGFGPGTHLRRVHYVLLSQASPIMLPVCSTGMGRPSRPGPYENTVQCWEKLIHTSRDARYLGLIPYEHVIDRRNDAPIEFVRNNACDAQFAVPISIKILPRNTGPRDFPPDCRTRQTSNSPRRSSISDFMSNCGPRRQPKTTS
jgi:hypothetical protein